MPGAVPAPCTDEVCGLYYVYSVGDESPEVEWIMQGTDGKRYVVPAEPGG